MILGIINQTIIAFLVFGQVFSITALIASDSNISNDSVELNAENISKLSALGICNLGKSRYFT